MFFADPVAAAQDKLPVGRQTDGLSDVAIVVASLITVGFGLWPEPLLKLAEHAAALLP
jgi:NADH:ubiquinone oxidoreductase subunit 2 (subunit N)